MKSNVIAVTEAVPRAGTILMWTLSGGTDLAQLRAHWVAAGLDADELPSATTPAVALRRAVNELREKHRLVRPLGKGEGFAVVSERTQGEDLEYAIELRAKLNEYGGDYQLVVDGGTDGDRWTIHGCYAKHLGQLTSEDVSHWLTKMIPELDGVSMRATGGVYFIPHTKLEQLNRVVEVLQRATNHSVYRIPAMCGDDAVAAILDAVEQEAVAEAKAMEADIEAAALGSKAFEHRIKRTDAVEQKVTRYEALLGARLEGLRERLDTLRTNLGIAMVKALNAADKAAE